MAKSPSRYSQGKLCFIQLSTRMAAWLLLAFFISLHKQLRSIRSIHSRIKEYRCLKNVIHQIDSKNEWLQQFLRQNLGWFLS